MDILLGILGIFVGLVSLVSGLIIIKDEWFKRKTKKEKDKKYLPAREALIEMIQMSYDFQFSGLIDLEEIIKASEINSRAVRNINCFNDLKIFSDRIRLIKASMRNRYLEGIDNALPNLPKKWLGLKDSIHYTENNTFSSLIFPPFISFPEPKEETLALYIKEVKEGEFDKYL